MLAVLTFFFFKLIKYIWGKNIFVLLIHFWMLIVSVCKANSIYSFSHALLWLFISFLKITNNQKEQFLIFLACRYSYTSNQEKVILIIHSQKPETLHVSQLNIHVHFRGSWWRRFWVRGLLCTPFCCCFVFLFAYRKWNF